MNSEAQSAIRNSGMLLIQRGLEGGIGLLIALVIPRLMGPETYGKYALITSISFLFVLLSRLGFREVISRYIPRFREDSSSDALRSFFSSLVAIRAVLGFLAAILFFVLARWWLGDFRAPVMVITAGTVLLRAISELMGALFLGLNRAGRWGATGLIRRGFSFLLVIVGYQVNGLEGAMFGWLVVELFLLILGTIWTRSYLSPLLFRPRIQTMAPFLRFGFTYFVSNMVLSVFRRSGEVFVRGLTEDYVEVGYFGLAYNIYLAAALVMPHLTLAFVPFLTRPARAGNATQLRRWVERLLKVLTIGAILSVFATLLLREGVVPLVLGTAYRPVAGHMIPLTLALLFVALSSVARMLLLVFEAPRQALVGSVIRLGVFCLTVIPIILLYQSLGACIAELVASVAFAIYLTQRARLHNPYDLRAWWLTLLASVPFLGLLVLRGTLLVNMGLYLGFLGGYGALLFGLRLVTLDEIREVWRILTDNALPLGERIGG